MNLEKELISCHVCHLIQRFPADLEEGYQPVCCRCEATLDVHDAAAQLAWTRSATLASLLCYPLAVTLPILRIERLGHVTESSIVGAIATLFAQSYFGLGAIVLLCSVLLPLGKLTGLWIICSPSFFQARHRATTYQFVEWSGRWGMVDVLLVAVLVASLKIGDLVNVSPGPGALLFATFVFFSLLASYFFQPRTIWESHD